MDLCRYTTVVLTVLMFSSFVFTQGWGRRGPRHKRRHFWDRFKFKPKWDRFKSRPKWDRFKFRPKLDTTIIICKWKSKAVRCRDDKVLSITSAQFGRTNENTCRPIKLNKGKCLTDITPNIKQQCEGRSYCKVTVNRNVFGNYCPNVAGYLKMILRCISQAPIAKTFCISKPCQNGGICTEEAKGYRCTCRPGFSGFQCQIDPYCVTKPCRNGGTCTSNVNGYTCACKPGFTGYQCETDNTIKKYCSSKPCKNGGVCKEGVRGYTCICKPGLTGKQCQANINECVSKPCKNGGICKDKINDYTCKCKPGYTGKQCQTDIDDCVSKPCKNDGTCKDGINMYTCICKQGFTGKQCQSNLNLCTKTSCMNGGICKNGIGGFTCTCKPGFTGKLCHVDIDECASKPCLNDGLCQDEVNSFKCICKRGYTGATCKTNINDCIGKPCKNGGICKDAIDDFTCKCKPGFTGKKCQTDIDDCISKPCKNGGICKDGINSFSCICKSFYTGKVCEIAPKGCVSMPCQNGGVCKDEPNGHKCICKPGFVGANCQTGMTCKNKPCENAGVCKNVVDGYLCTCKPGFTGVNCQIDIDDCAAKPCQNGGVCKDQINGYKCTCKPGFVGVNCDKETPVECGTPYWNPTFIAWRIVGGIAARNYSWPWIVQLRIKNKHECGGAIIAPQWIATARHCFLANTNPGDWSILAGRTHKSAPEPETEQIRIASKIIPCPNPTLSFLNKDICLVKVDKEFMYNRYVRPICLPTRPVKQTDRCYVKGWGSTYGTGHDQVLKQTHLPVKDTKACNSTINKAMVGQITNDMFCAGHANGGHDACQGDSGGPFDCQYGDGKWYLSGIVSWGIGCAKKNMPGVYANVVNFVEWIEETLASN